MKPLSVEMACLLGIQNGIQAVQCGVSQAGGLVQPSNFLLIPAAKARMAKWIKKWILNNSTMTIVNLVVTKSINYKSH